MVRSQAELADAWESSPCNDVHRVPLGLVLFEGRAEMLIEERRASTDPLVMSDIIVSSLLADLKAPTRPKPQKIGVRNVLRLIRAYEDQAFDHSEHLGILENDDFESFADLTASDGPARLFAALKATHERYSPGSSAELFAGLARRTITGLLSDPLTPEEESQATQFLEILRSAIVSA